MKRFVLTLSALLFISFVATRFLKSQQRWPFAGATPIVDRELLVRRFEEALRRSPRPAATIYLTSRVSAPQGVLLASRISRAVRSNGDWAERIDNARVPLITREIRLAGGSLVHANDLAGAKSTFRQHRLSNLSKLMLDLDPATGCRSPRPELGSEGQRPLVESGESILGFRTVKAVSADTRRTTIKWLAPEIGCAELQAIHEFRDASGKVEGTNWQVAERVELGEPGATLFQTDTLAETKPSEVFRRYVDFRKELPPAADFVAYRDLDAAYTGQRR